MTAMRIEALTRCWQVASPALLEEALLQAHDPRGECWTLWFGGETHRRLNLHFQGELAYAVHFPDEPHPGFVSAGPGPGLPDGETAFPLNASGEALQVPNQYVVSFAAAAQAARDFLATRGRSPAIAWEEL